MALVAQAAERSAPTTASALERKDWARLAPDILGAATFVGAGTASRFLKRWLRDVLATQNEVADPDGR